MRWVLLLLVGLPVSLGALCASAQPLDDGGHAYEPMPTPVRTQPPGAEGTRYFSANVLTAERALGDGPAVEFSECEPVVELPDSGPVCEPSRPDPIDGFLGYRYELSSTEWIIGNGEQFGMFSLDWDHYKGTGVKQGFGVGLQFHFLSGPIQTDMPARVYDFSLAYQHRDQLGIFSYDVAASVMASSDFEGNSREGVRFPGHAVGFLSLGPKTDLVFGVDYLDRGDVKLLPVGGLIMVPHPDVRLEVVFPRPRAVFRLTGCHQLYVCGELGGGTWAIERAATLEDDLATYRDLRLCIGLQSVDDDGDCTAVEIGYLFDRRLEYTSGNGDFRPNDTAMIRFVQTF